MGKNFSKTAKNNKVTFGAATAIPIFSRADTSKPFDSLHVIVPSGATTAIPTVTVGSKSAVARDTFWITTGKWIRMADCPSGGRFSGTAFGIGNKGYLGLGTGEGGSTPYLKDLWEFDPATNKWTRKADFPAGTVRECTSFVIGGIAFVGLGTNTETFSPNNSLYAYDPSTDTWTLKAPFPYGPTIDVVGLAAAGKAYITTGFYTTQFVTYDPAGNAWTQKPDFPGLPRSAASGFVINDELYVGGGNSGQSASYTDCWKYSPSTDKWTRLADAFGPGYPAASFSLNGKGYRLVSLRVKGTGFYEYDPATDKWAMKKAFPGIAYGYQMSFVAANRAFITGGLYSNTYSAETWEFVP